MEKIWTQKEEKGMCSGHVSVMSGSSASSNSGNILIQTENGGTMGPSAT